MRLYCKASETRLSYLLRELDFAIRNDDVELVDCDCLKGVAEAHYYDIGLVGVSDGTRHSIPALMTDEGGVVEGDDAIIAYVRQHTAPDLDPISVRWGNPEDHE